MSVLCVLCAVDYYDVFGASWGGFDKRWKDVALSVQREFGLHQPPNFNTCKLAFEKLVDSVKEQESARESTGVAKDPVMEPDVLAVLERLMPAVEAHRAQRTRYVGSCVSVSMSLYI